MVVISIIAVLVAILLPVLQSSRYTARLTLCGNNLRQITVGLTTYANDAKGFYPDDEVAGMPKQSPARIAVGAADYVGGSVDARENELLQCPQVAFEGDLLRDVRFSHYQRYFNVTSSLASGSANLTGSHGEPNVYTEAMPRIDDTRLTEGLGFFGGGVWSSTILISDIAQQWSGFVQTGHMPFSRDATGGSANLSEWTDSDAIANYAFQDGSVQRFRFSHEPKTVPLTERDGIIASSGGAGDWDKFILPREAISQLQ